MIAGHVHHSEDVTEWSYYRFYNLVSYLSHLNAYRRRLDEVYKRKK